MASSERKSQQRRAYISAPQDYKDVGRLDVAVHHSFGVSSSQGVGNLDRQANHLIERV
jgi:hypothetical protein